MRGVLRIKSQRRRAFTVDEPLRYVWSRYRLAEKEPLATGRTWLPAEACVLVAWRALETQPASLTTLAQRFGRDISTFSHERVRSSMP